MFFEKENIHTFDSNGEMLITIMSSTAQEESRSISENITWGHRKRFADGKLLMAFSTFLGYDRGPNGEPVINEVKQASCDALEKEMATHSSILACKIPWMDHPQ